MNKQEIIDYILKEIETHKDNSLQTGYCLAMIRVYDKVKQLDELKQALMED